MIGLVAGLARGAIAGAAAAYVMKKVDAWMRVRLDEADSIGEAERDIEREQREPAHALDRKTDADIDHSTKEMLASAARYGLGALFGIIGAIVRKRVTKGRGFVLGSFAFGAITFLIDEFAKPFLGVARGPQDEPWTAHARGLVAHTAYALTSNGVRAALGA